MDLLHTHSAIKYIPYAQTTAQDLRENTPCSLLLMQALDYLHMHRYEECKDLLLHAREQLPPEQGHIASSIDALLQHYPLYIQAQEELLLASKKFAAADDQQQVNIEQLKTLIENYDQESDKKQPASGITAAKVHPTMPVRLAESQTVRLLPALHVRCLGRFEVRCEDRLLTLCQNRCGQAILRYLVVQSHYRAMMDVMMDIFWPNDMPETARRKLQVAVSALRCSLNRGYDCDPGGGYILCKNKLYQINPIVSITSDVHTFLALYEQGRQAHEPQRITLYEQACQIYTGPFLVEDMYMDWASRQREQYSLAYLAMCHTLAEHALRANNYDTTILWSNRILTENRCDETAYRQLMQAYAAQGRRSEALRQFQHCKQILHEELGISPTPETTHVYHSILASTI